MSQVQNFMEETHAGRYRVFNLCAARAHAHTHAQMRGHSECVHALVPWVLML